MAGIVGRAPPRGGAAPPTTSKETTQDMNDVASEEFTAVFGVCFLGFPGSVFVFAFAFVFCCCCSFPLFSVGRLLRLFSCFG